MNMRQRLSTIITLTITVPGLLLGVPVIALAQTPASLTLNPTTVSGGVGVHAQVNLTGPAPAGGLVGA